MKSRTIFTLAFLMVFSLCAVAFAQDDTATTDDDTAASDDATDDDADFAATLEFSSPEALDADTEYDFTFTVSNTTTGDIQRWINDIELYLPAPAYVLDQNLPDAPNALHSGTWDNEVITDETDAGTYYGIHWMFTGVVTSESYGDIHEGESLDFAFKATTDGDATDGFPWRMVALDEGAVEYYLEGVAYISGADDDSDDDTSVDDDVSSGDDDDSGGGCGC